MANSHSRRGSAASTTSTTEPRRPSVQASEQGSFMTFQIGTHTLSATVRTNSRLLYIARFLAIAPIPILTASVLVAILEIDKVLNRRFLFAHFDAAVHIIGASSFLISFCACMAIALLSIKTSNKISTNSTEEDLYNQDTEESQANLISASPEFVQLRYLCCALLALLTISGLILEVMQTLRLVEVVALSQISFLGIMFASLCASLFSIIGLLALYGAIIPHLQTVNTLDAALVNAAVLSDVHYIPNGANPVEVEERCESTNVNPNLAKANVSDWAQSTFNVNAHLMNSPTSSSDENASSEDDFKGPETGGQPSTLVDNAKAQSPMLTSTEHRAT